MARTFKRKSKWHHAYSLNTAKKLTDASVKKAIKELEKNLEKLGDYLFHDSALDRMKLRVAAYSELTSFRKIIERYQTELEALIYSHQTNSVITSKMAALKTAMLLELEADSFFQKHPHKNSIIQLINETTNKAITFREKHLSGIDTPSRDFVEEMAIDPEKREAETKRIVDKTKEQIDGFVVNPLSTKNEILKRPALANTKRMPAITALTDLIDPDAPANVYHGLLPADFFEDPRVSKHIADIYVVTTGIEGVDPHVLQKALTNIPPGPVPARRPSPQTVEQAIFDIRQRLTNIQRAQQTENDRALRPGNVLDKSLMDELTAAEKQAQEDIATLQFQVRVPNYQTIADNFKREVAEAHQSFSDKRITKAGFDDRIHVAKLHFTDAVDKALATLRTERTTLANTVVGSHYHAYRGGISENQKKAELAALDSVIQKLDQKKTADLTKALTVAPAAESPKPDPDFQTKLQLFLIFKRREAIKEEATFTIPLINKKVTPPRLPDHHYIGPITLPTPEDLTEEDIATIRAIDPKKALDDAITSSEDKKQGLEVSNGIYLNFAYRKEKDPKTNKEKEVRDGSKYTLRIDTTKKPTREDYAALGAVLRTVAKGDKGEIVIKNLPKKNPEEYIIRLMEASELETDGKITIKLNVSEDDPNHAYNDANSPQYQQLLAKFNQRKAKLQQEKKIVPQLEKVENALAGPPLVDLEETRKRAARRESEAIKEHPDFAASGVSDNELKQAVDADQGKREAILAAAADPAFLNQYQARIVQAGAAAVDVATKMIRRTAELREVERIRAEGNPQFDAGAARAIVDATAEVRAAVPVVADPTVDPTPRRVLKAGEDAVGLAESRELILALDAHVEKLKEDIDKDRTLTDPQRSTLKAMLDLCKQSRIQVEGGQAGIITDEDIQRSEKQKQALTWLNENLMLTHSNPTVRSLLTMLEEQSQQQRMLHDEAKARLSKHQHIQVGYVRELQPGLTDEDRKQIARYERRREKISAAETYLRGKINEPEPGDYKDKDYKYTLKDDVTLTDQEKLVFDALQKHFTALHDSAPKILWRRELQVYKSAYQLVHELEEKNLVKLYDNYVTYIKPDLSPFDNDADRDAAVPESTRTQVDRFNKLHHLEVANYWNANHLLGRLHPEPALSPEGAAADRQAIHDALHALHHALSTPDYLKGEVMDDSPEVKRRYEEFARNLDILRQAPESSWKEDPAATPTVQALIEKTKVSGPVDLVTAIVFLGTLKNADGSWAYPDQRHYYENLCDEARDQMFTKVSYGTHVNKLPKLSAQLQNKFVPADGARSSPNAAQKAIEALFDPSKTAPEFSVLYEGFRHETELEYNPVLLRVADKEAAATSRIDLCIALKGVDLLKRFPTNLKLSKELTALASANKICDVYHALNNDYQHLLVKISGEKPPATAEQQQYLRLQYRQHVKALLNVNDPEHSLFSDFRLDSLDELGGIAGRDPAGNTDYDIFKDFPSLLKNAARRKDEDDLNLTTKQNTAFASGGSCCLEEVSLPRSRWGRSSQQEKKPFSAASTNPLRSDVISGLKIYLTKVKELYNQQKKQLEALYTDPPVLGKKIEELNSAFNQKLNEALENLNPDEPPPAPPADPGAGVLPSSPPASPLDSDSDDSLLNAAAAAYDIRFGEDAPLRPDTIPMSRLSSTGNHFKYPTGDFKSNDPLENLKGYEKSLESERKANEVELRVMHRRRH